MFTIFDLFFIKAVLLYDWTTNENLPLHSFAPDWTSSNIGHRRISYLVS